ncbi:MAG TPA: cytochrome b/b6 domain-containing protein [Verrucomicrobiae bacterium]
MKPSTKLFYTALCVGIAVLAFTGIGVFAFGKPPMTHWVLLAHVTAAPIFAVALALVALAWLDFHRPKAAAQPPYAAKALFWLVLICGLLAALSGVVPMTPIFGTDGEHALYLTHRYAGIAAAAALVVHVILVVGSRGSRP